MKCIQEQRKVYTVKLSFGSKSFFTPLAAARKMAREKIMRKYPSESPDFDDSGRMEYPGFYWKESIPRSEVMYRRMTKIYLKSIKG